MNKFAQRVRRRRPAVVRSRMGWIVAIAAIFATVAMAGGVATYKIRSGDALDQIARNLNLDRGCLLRQNPKIKDPNRIFAGDVLNVAGCEKGGATPAVAGRATSAPVAKGDLGGMTPAQIADLERLHLSGRRLQNAAQKHCQALRGEVCHNELRRLILTKGGPTVRVPSTMAPPPPPAPVPAEKDVVLICKAEGDFRIEGDFGAVRALDRSVDLACMVDLGNGWAAGPLFHASMGEFLGLGWKEFGSTVGGGIRLRKSGGEFWDEIKVDLAGLKGCSEGGTVGGDVRRGGKCGVDVWAVIYGKHAGIKLSEHATADIELTAFLRVPIVGNTADVTYKGTKVGKTDARGASVGAMARMPINDDRVPFIFGPEAGLWVFSANGDEELGGKAGVFARNRRGTLLFGAGVKAQPMHGYWTVEANVGRDVSMTRHEGYGNALEGKTTPVASPISNNPFDNHSW